MKSRAIVATALVALAFGLPGLARAAKPAKPTSTVSGSSSSITLNQADPHLGGQVNFTVSYPSSVKQPLVGIRCYQNGVLGYGEAGYATGTFTLGGGASDWKTGGGVAQCTAELYYIEWQGSTQTGYYTLATTAFNAAG